MHGRTKSFFEDIIIVVVTLVSIYGLYYLYSNYNTKKNIEQPIVVEKISEPKVESQPKITVKQLVDKTKKEPIIKDINRSSEEKKIVEKEAEIVVKKIDEVVKKEEKNVDLKMLRAFLIETQYKIRKNIIYPQDTNGTKKDTFMRLKITILKDGSYEQLRFVEGDKELFNLNKENILKVFPLFIDKKIVDDFPRYFRMKIK